MQRLLLTWWKINPSSALLWFDLQWIGRQNSDYWFMVSHPCSLTWLAICNFLMNRKEGGCASRFLGKLNAARAHTNMPFSFEEGVTYAQAWTPSISICSIFFLYGLEGCVENIFPRTLRGQKGATPFLCRTTTKGPLTLDRLELAIMSYMTLLIYMLVTSNYLKQSHL